MKWFFGMALLLVFSHLRPVYATEAVSCEVKTRFSSDGSLADAVMDEIRQAKSKVLLALYGFNNPILADGLMSVAKRGVAVKIKIDAAKATEKRESRIIQRLRTGGVQVQAVAAGGRNHNKFAVIDQGKVITGSYNWTTKAESNWENLLFLDCPALAKKYEEEWARIE